jgi:hypothetical protein
MKDEVVRAVHERLDGEPFRSSRTEMLIPVMFTLEDGREVQSNHRCKRADADAYVKLLPRDINIPLHEVDVVRTMEEMPLDHHG